MTEELRFASRDGACCRCFTSRSGASTRRALAVDEPAASRRRARVSSGAMPTLAFHDPLPDLRDETYEARVTLDGDEYRFRDVGAESIPFLGRRSRNNYRALALLLRVTTRRKGQIRAGDASFSLYEIRPKEREPSRSLVRLREDLVRFRKCYQASLAAIMRAQSEVQELCLFPAIPAPAAIACGQDLLPKVHPDIAVFDNVKGTFRRMITINSSDAL